MNKTVRTVASVMIVLLAVVLIVIFATYNSNHDYGREKNQGMHVSGEPILNKNSGEVIKEKNQEEKEHIKEEIISGESPTTSGDIEQPTIFESGEIDTRKPPKKPERKEPPKPSSNDNAIISSRTETSNQEKQEILNEIDDALKGLLDAVGKVKTVDETKLDASLESEVEP
jgi:cell division protein FtsN